MATIPVPMDDQATVSMQQNFAIVTQGVQQSAQQHISSNQFIAEQARLNHLENNQLQQAVASNLLQGHAAILAGATLGAREVRDQPQVSPAGAFQPTVGNPTPAPPKTS